MPPDATLATASGAVPASTAGTAVLVLALAITVAWLWALVR